MTAQRMTFSGRSEGPLGRLTADHPGLLIEGTPMVGSILLRCSGDREGVEMFVRSLSQESIARHDLGDREEISAVARLPAEVAALLKIIDSSDLLLLPPLRWNAGRITLRVLASRDHNPTIAPFPGMKLEGKVPLRDGEAERELLSSGLLLPSLTAKQGQAVLAALDGGYYDTPRGSTAGQIARRMGVARSTFEEHLKSAEAQIISALAPLVRVRVTELVSGKEEAGAEALHLYSRFSEDLGLYVNLTLRAGAVSSVSFSKGEPAEPHGADHPYLARIIEHLSTGKDDLRDIPLDLPVSGFEMEVLDLLRTIPPGEVLTYGEVARRLGRPRAGRAVGNACAHNPAIVVVPCHRVVPSSGGVGNYSGGCGPATKIQLLQKEGAMEKIKGRTGKGSSVQK